MCLKSRPFSIFWIKASVTFWFFLQYCHVLDKMNLTFFWYSNSCFQMKSYLWFIIYYFDKTLTSDKRVLCTCTSSKNKSIAILNCRCLIGSYLFSLSFCRSVWLLCFILPDCLFVFRIFVSFLSINIFVNQLDSRQEIVLFVNCCPRVKSLETDITIFSDRKKQLKKWASKTL